MIAVPNNIQSCGCVKTAANRKTSAERGEIKQANWNEIKKPKIFWRPIYLFVSINQFSAYRHHRKFHTKSKHLFKPLLRVTNTYVRVSTQA